jgi:hypothetical protein
MNDIVKRASISLAVFLIAIYRRALAQNFGPGGIRPDPALQAAAKAQTETRRPARPLFPVAGALVHHESPFPGLFLPDHNAPVVIGE